MKHYQFRVEGMTCGGCVAAVKNVLSRQPGVSQAHLRVEIGSIELDLDEAVGSVESVRKAVEKAGYSFV
jgi:copper chaperone CopZ